MARQSFYDILKSSRVNIQAEYNRLHMMMYEGTDCITALDSIIENYFEYLPKELIGRTLSLDDFNDTYGFYFSKKKPVLMSPDDLISFCEYIVNFCIFLKSCAGPDMDEEEEYTINQVLKNIDGCIEDLGLMPLQKEGFTVYVPKDPTVIAVAEIVNEALAVNILEYHHHQLRGKLEKKKAILKLMADDIESERKMLRSINATLETQLFELLNKFVRHDHSKTPYIGEMSNKRIENCYDDIYQMWLLAKLELDHLERKRRVTELLKNINGN